MPESYIVAGDPYQRQIEECVKLIGLEVNRLLTVSVTASTSTAGEEDTNQGTPNRFPRDVSLALAGHGQGQELSSATVRATDPVPPATPSTTSHPSTSHPLTD